MNSRDDKAFAVLNPQYPSSYWMVGRSNELDTGEIVPVTALEKDVVLWRDSRGALHCAAAHCVHLGANLGFGGEVVDDTIMCPFHRWRYDSRGRVVAQEGIEGSPRTSTCLSVYRVVERYGGIYLWNGQDPPDHEFPDVLNEDGLDEESVSIEHVGFMLPFPAKYFAENAADAAHLAMLHGSGISGETEVVDKSATTLTITQRLFGRKRYSDWPTIKRLWRRGEIWGLADLAGSDLHWTVYGGGLHIVRLLPVPDESYVPARSQFIARHTTHLAQRVESFMRSTVLIICWSPVTERSFKLFFTMIVPKLRAPLVGPLGQRTLRAMWIRRNWFASVQDTAVMMNRKEQDAPAYSRLDKALVEFRRFWDSRLLDRRLWEGDDVHSNGRRARIAWPEAAVGTSNPTAPTGESRAPTTRSESR